MFPVKIGKLERGPLNSSAGNYVLEVTKHLIEIESVNPPGLEREAASYVAELLSELRMPVRMDEVQPGRTNVTGTLEGSGQGCTLMLNGHLDVVPPGDLRQWNQPPFQPRIVGERLFGRGACDMKGGIAAILGAARSVVENKVKLRGNLLVTFVADEESLGRGINNLVDRGCAADMAVIAEPTNLELIIAHKGLIWLELTVFGRSAHASTVKSRGEGGGINAIYKMCEAISTIESHLSALERRKHPLVGNPTVSVGTITGGTKPNVVPDSCTAIIERRLLPDERPDQVTEEIRMLLDGIADSDPYFRYNLTPLVIREAGEIRRDEKIVSLCMKSVRDVTGSDPAVTGFVATSDMGVLVKRARIPTVLLGPGNLEQAHTPNEFVMVKDLVTASKIYERLILNALQ